MGVAAGIGLGMAAVALALSAPLSLMAQETTIEVPAACLVDAVGGTADGKTPVTLEACDIKVPIGVTLDPAPPWRFNTGTNLVEWSSTSSAGTLSTATHSIIVMDTTPPKLTPPDAASFSTAEARVTITAEGDPNTWLLGQATAPDVTSPASKVSVIHNAPKTLAIGVHTVLWTATDEAGRTATATQRVTVKDVGNPTIVSCPPDVRFDTNDADRKFPGLGTIPKEHQLDNDPGSLVLTNDADDQTDTNGDFPVGVTYVTWTLTDGAGNTYECVQRVYILPTQTELTIPPTGSVDGTRFGRAMAHTGDLLIVGNEHSSREAPKSGEVTAYRLSDGSQAYRLSHPAPYKNQNFGAALAVVVEPSGAATLAVGAPGAATLTVGETSPSTNTGEVFLYDAATGTRKDATMRNPNTASPNADRFGASLAAVGRHVLVGAPMYDAGAYVDSGRAYVFDLSGSLQYEIANGDDHVNDRFGKSVAAGSDGTSDRIYIGAGKHTDKTTKVTTNGVVYIYDVTSTTNTAGVPEPKPALSDPGTSNTHFGGSQLRPAAGGGVYVGEATIVSDAGAVTGKIRLHAADGSRSGTIDAPACCEASFGSAFDLDGRLLYAGNPEVGTKGRITAFDPAALSRLDSFVDDTDKPAGHTTTHFGFAVELVGDGKLAVAEYLEGAGSKKTRVHVLDLRTLAPTPTPAPAQGGQGGSGSETVSQAQSQAQAPAQPTASVRLAAPELVSTEHVSPGQVRLTYSVQVDPFEVDSTDYVLSDVSLAIVSADVAGRVVTLTYVDALTGLAPAAGAARPGVELIGGIGHY